MLKLYHKEIAKILPDKKNYFHSQNHAENSISGKLLLVGVKISKENAYFS